ncbi:hypothetical protein FK535_00750 [Mycolicibacterium sp. 018/SC-01/001]|uniref:hypothetical protein n=1 Tax=Mycolicibacterium sp. 018/SC-01/001 TaxID=2592069 RepID=UPI00117DDCE8|nr:hypothetical protein [Mycolicibacterium sp. 018/SC-01/001]TRW88847.1 hypothetical protein FK535_00750 [Mycolicibacterium sp. 018/SC-01/001]
MEQTPVSAALAEYRGKQFPIVFSDTDWVALGIDRDTEIPDAFAFGDYPSGSGRRQKWAKVPRTSLDGIVHRRVRGTIRGHRLTLQKQLPDGRISVDFIGPPAVARELGLDGDQYMGWTGLFNPEDFDSIEVEETRRG